MSEGFEADLLGYSPPLSLWNLVEQHVASHERDEIKSVLGIGIIEETLELHNELQAFLEIWRDCRHKTDQNDKPTKVLRLPEPPGMRDRLIQEIKFFIENVREKAQEQGRDENDSLRHHNHNIIDYAISDSRASSCDQIIRPQSVIGQDGKETPFYRYGSPLSDRVSSSTYSTLSEDVEAMADKLNVLKVDEVLQHLRSYLSDEKEWLVQDLRFLQQCIEEENDIASAAPQHIEEPTIGELREERLKLEKEMLSDLFTHQKSLHKTLPCLKPVSARNRTSVVPINRPLKAVHMNAPDGIVLAGNVPESVVVKTQQKLSEQVLDHSSIINMSKELKPEDRLQACHSPDSSSSSSRPSSARKFRSMIISARSVSS